MSVVLRKRSAARTITINSLDLVADYAFSPGRRRRSRDCSNCRYAYLAALKKNREKKNTKNDKSQPTAPPMTLTPLAMRLRTSTGEQHLGAELAAREGFIDE